MGGLRSVMREVAPMINSEDTSVEKKTKIKPKGIELKRKSIRKAGEDDTIEEINIAIKSRSLLSLRKS